MNSAIRRMVGAISRALGATPIGYFPVRVRTGRAKGAHWTLLPFSSNWRRGEPENDVAQAASYLPTLEGITFWDIGAHFGIHTVGMAMTVGQKGQVAAFEPDPAAFDRLRYHVGKNRLKNVRLFDAAASRTTGRGDLFLPGGQGTTHSHFKYYADNDMTGTASLSVRTVALDDLVQSGSIRLPDLIKIDVQGHGAEALAGAANSIKASLPIIAFSTHSDAERHGARDLLSPMGYSPRFFDGTVCDWTDIADPKIFIPT
jgi:FkbM family methyltransferase